VCVLIFSDSSSNPCVFFVTLSTVWS